MKNSSNSLIIRKMGVKKYYFSLFKLGNCFQWMVRSKKKRVWNGYAHAMCEGTVN